MSAPEPLGRSDGWTALGVAALAIAFQLPTFDRTMSLLDEGHILQFADLLHRGGELYRDATLLPLPGAFVLLAFLFDLAEPSIRVARWLVVFEFAAFAAVVYLLMRQLASPRAAWCAVGVAFLYKVWAFPHWQMYSYSTTAQLLLATAVALVVRFHARPAPRTLVLAGLATGLAVVCKQDYGGAGLLAMNAAILLASGRSREPHAPGRLRALAWYNLPVVAVGALTALHFLRQGLFGAMLQQTLLNHLLGISSGEYTGLPPILPLLEADPTYRELVGLGAYTPALVFTVDWALVGKSAFFRESVLWDWCIEAFFYAPYVIAAAGLVRALLRRGALRDASTRVAFLQETTLVAFAAAAIAALNRPVDWVHVAVLTWPGWLLLVLWGARSLAAAPASARRAALLLLIPALLLGGYSVRLLARLHDQFDTPLRTSRAGVLVGADEEAVIGSAVDWLREHSEPGEKAAVLPYFPLISFLAERDAPHPETYTLWPIEYDPRRQPEVIEALDEAADVAVYHFTQAAQLPRMRDYTPQVFEYLVDHWRIETVFSDPGWGYMLAGLRRVGPAVGTPLLGADAGPPRLWIEGPAGSRRRIEAARREDFFRTDLWPFRRVFALRPSCGAQRTGLGLPLDVPTGARLQSAVGVDPIRWFRFPPSAVDWELRITEAGEVTTVFRQRLDPHRDRRDRRWVEIDLDLAPWAGRHVTLEFTTHCEGESGRDLAMGGFEIPRLVLHEQVRPADTATAPALAPAEDLWQAQSP